MKFATIITVLCACFFFKTGAQSVYRDTSTINRELLISHLNFLANDSLKGRGNYTRELSVAADYIAREFKRLNLKVLSPFKSYYQLFTNISEKRKNKEVDSLKAGNYQYVLKNVIGVLPGTTKPEEIVIISAHYDHLGSTGPSSAEIFNGANDNASGVAALLALAQYYASRKDNSRTLIFCAFAGEELGLLGSAVLANGFKPHVITCMINLEMLGRYGKRNKNSFFITGANYSNLAQIMRKNLAGSVVKIIREPSADKGLFERSDNYPFALKGIPAHTLMSSDDDDACYHQGCDKIQGLDVNNMTTLVRVIANGVESIINGTDTPTRIKKL
jgi:Iap family predicted aminopeptidase